MTPDYILRSYEAKQSVCARKSFFWTGSFAWTSWIRSPDRTDLLANQNSLSDAWQSLQLEMSQNSSVLWWINSCSASVPPPVTEVRKQFDSDLRPMSRWYAHVWTELLNEAEKVTFLWFLMVYVKRWTDQDYFVHLICSKHAKHPHVTSQLGAIIITVCIRYVIVWSCKRTSDLNKFKFLWLWNNVVNNV